MTGKKYFISNNTGNDYFIPNKYTSELNSLKSAVAGANTDQLRGKLQNSGYLPSALKICEVVSGSWNKTSCGCSGSTVTGNKTCAVSSPASGGLDYANCVTGCSAASVACTSSDKTCLTCSLAIGVSKYSVPQNSQPFKSNTDSIGGYRICLSSGTPLPASNWSITGNNPSNGSIGTLGAAWTSQAFQFGYRIWLRFISGV